MCFSTPAVHPLSLAEWQGSEDAQAPAAVHAPRGRPLPVEAEGAQEAWPVWPYHLQVRQLQMHPIEPIPFTRGSKLAYKN